jgi:hypothetical protein
MFYAMRHGFRLLSEKVWMKDNTSNPRCSYRTRRNIDCRNLAAPGTEPPACRHHRPPLPAQSHVAPGPYFAALTEEEKALWQDQGAQTGLAAEVALVRTVLARLIDRLNDPAYVLLPEDLVRLASLIFTGARTVAQLVSRAGDESGDIQPWLAQALDVLASDFPDER